MREGWMEFAAEKWGDVELGKIGLLRERQKVIHVMYAVCIQFLT